MAGSLVGRGQFTLVKLHDGKSMQLHLQCNHPTVQIYSSQDHSFTPDYAKEPLTITPELFFSGSDTDQIGIVSNPKWTINDGKALEYAGSSSSSSPWTLTVSKNLATAAQLDVEFECDVKDPDTLLTVHIAAHVCIAKSETANPTPTMLLETPDGTFFKNEVFSELTATCKLMIGSESVGTKYTWYAENKNGVFEEFEDTALLKGQGTDTLTVGIDYVEDEASFKCDVRYAGVTYSEYVTFSRQSDPYTLKIENKNGDKMKNGDGVIYCEAHVYRGDEMVDDTEAEEKFTFRWKRYNKYTGVEDKTWGKQTRAIELTANDIDKLSTFMCELALKNDGFTYVLPMTLE